MANRRRAMLVQQRAVYIVLNNVHAETPGDVGNLPPTTVRHQAGGRVVQVRRAHQRGDALVAAHVFEMFRVNAITVHLQAFEGEPQYLGVANHSVIGDPFAKYYIIGARQRCQRKEDTVGRAIGNQDVIALDPQSLPSDPAHGLFAVRLETGNWTKCVNPRLILFRAELAAGVTPALVVLAGVQDPRDGKIHEGPFGAIENIGSHSIAHAPRHKAAAPDFATHQPLALQLFIGVGDRLHTDAHGIGNVPLRWQAVIIDQDTLLDIVGNCLH